MIGGTDVIFACPVEGEKALRPAFRAIVQFWRRAVVEDADTAELLDLVLPAAGFAGAASIMVYKNAKARESWEHLGADPSNANTMVHVLSSVGRMTLVVDDEDDPEMAQIIEAVKSLVASDILSIPADREPRRQVAA